MEGITAAAAVLSFVALVIGVVAFGMRLGRLEAKLDRIPECERKAERALETASATSERLARLEGARANG